MDACFSLRALPERSAAELVDATLHALEHGARLVSWYGRPRGEEVGLRAVLLGATGELAVLTGSARAGDGYPALTTVYAGAQALERELWEQTGLVPEGHPWLKPIRYEGARQGRMHEHDFYRVEGKEVHEVAVGPVHAGVIEPGHFRFMCLGEGVHHLEIQLGYQHRGVERELLARPPAHRPALVETIAGDSSIAYALAYARAIEGLAGASLRDEIALVREVALELERVAMHLAGLSGLATDIAFLQGASTYGRLRTALINLSMRACGSRFGRSWIRPGGVRAGLDANDVRATLEAARRDAAQVDALMLDARSVAARFSGVGRVSAELAREIGLVGQAARASGLPIDLRAYDAPPMPPITEEGGDCWARMRVRQREIAASTGRILERLEGRAAIAPELAPVGALAPSSLCVALVEGWRGEVMIALETDEGGALAHAKAQDPSLKNWFGLAQALRDNDISDFPICNKSFDLSYCGNDL